jgi:hypothetical protein
LEERFVALVLLELAEKRNSGCQKEKEKKNNLECQVAA